MLLEASAMVDQGIAQQHKAGNGKITELTIPIVYKSVSKGKFTFLKNEIITVPNTAKGTIRVLMHRSTY